MISPISNIEEKNYIGLLKYGLQVKADVSLNHPFSEMGNMKLVFEICPHPACHVYTVVFICRKPI